LIRTFTFILLLFYFSINVYSQTIIDSTEYRGVPLTIDSITVSGNNITEDFIILRELTFGVGDTVTTKILNYNRERIFSLGIFNKVELKAAKENEKNVLHIIVEESWYIYPIPFAELENGDWKKFSYGLVVFIKNFRGRNETLSGKIKLGFDPAFSLKYYKPSIVYKSNVFFNAAIAYGTTRNRSETAKAIYGGDFDYTYVTDQVGLGYRFNTFNWAGIDFGYNYYESPKYYKGLTASNKRTDKIFSLGLSYDYDARDLIQFPREGTFFSYYMQFKGLGINNIDYRVFTIDFRQYWMLIGNLSGKIRFTTRLTAGRLIPFYDYSFLGFEEAVRGHFSTEREGNNYYLGSVEINHPIIKDVNVNLDFIPLLPRELLSFRLGLYAELFADMGTTQFRGEPIRLRDFDKGYGAGLSLLLLPYNLARFEFAFDEFGNSEFIFGLGTSF
jgi:outer membrane protein assembly factor BamA